MLYVWTEVQVIPTDSAASERVAAGASFDSAMVGPLVNTDTGVMYRVTVPVVATGGDTSAISRNTAG